MRRSYVSINPTRIGFALILACFVLTQINCGGGPKAVDPNAPRELKEFPADGGSSTKETDDEPGAINVEAACPADYPVLVECKKWWAETGTAGKDPFILKGVDGATKSQTENSCVCKGRHGARSKDFFGIANHYIRCGVTAVCANK